MIIQIKKHLIFMFSSMNILQSGKLYLILNISLLAIRGVNMKSWKLFISCRSPPTLFDDINLFLDILITLALIYILKWIKLLKRKSSANENIFLWTFWKIGFSIDNNIFNNASCLMFPISTGRLWVKFQIDSISSFW